MRDEDRGFCHVCCEQIKNSDGSDDTSTCDICGREGFCEYCAKHENHDCTEYE